MSEKKTIFRKVPQLRGAMAKDPETKRVEIHLLPHVKDALVALGKAERRSLKNYIEGLLEKHVTEVKKKVKPE